MRALRSLLAPLCSSLAVGAVVGCVLEFRPALSCGDGYVDARAGEECEPGVESSWEGACDGKGGTPSGPEICDPVTCTLDQEHCELCGNGIRDPGEECDGAVPEEVVCDLGAAKCTARCKLDRSECEACGDEKLDAHEECEWSLSGDFKTPIACTSLPTVSGTVKYGGGAVTYCKQDCKWDRKPCSFCGNGRLDSGEIQGPNNEPVTVEREVCDSDKVDLAALHELCAKPCGGIYDAQCFFVCDDCIGLRLAPRGDDPGCCIDSEKGIETGGDDETGGEDETGGVKLEECL